MKRQESDGSRAFMALVLLVSLSYTSFAVAQETLSVSEYILKRCQYLQQFKKVPVCSTCVASEITIPRFYMDRGYQPAWQDKNLRGQMIKAISDSYTHGLNPKDYHQQEINKLIAKIQQGTYTSSDMADLDVLLTDGLLRLSFHLFYGKVSPESLDPDWNFKREILDKDPARYLERVISSGNIKANIDKLWPHQPYYQVLRLWLKRYRELAKHPWPLVFFKKSLKVGMRGPDISLLRKRLAAEGYIKKQFPTEEAGLFDKELEDAVKDFQLHHGLYVDGVVGKNTVLALNLPPSFKVDKIRVNLERARWVLHDLPERFLLVNIAGFRLFYFENGEKKWSCKVMVGKPFWKTPVFKATMEYVVVNPYWVVPPGILEKEVIPKIKRDPSYLSKNDMEIVDAKGRWINPRSINWRKINPSRFPYIIRQRPGPKNALGRIKFIFPNKHFVFLHDTPAKSLFSRNMRAFSHGCIRVEKPLELARIIFKGSKRWNLEKIKEIISSGKNKIIHLENRIPILILYWTVVRNDDDTITFLPDIYSRDKKILIGLDTPLRVAFGPMEEKEASAPKLIKTAISSSFLQDTAL